jgi:aspartyl-tRNA(Asn)/glutamyl-tRNA(Gln) amidotransferase subunit C
VANKSSFTQTDVEHLSKLASLPLTEEQKEKFSTQLSSVLEFFSKLQEANTDGVEPFLGVKGSKDLRSDETAPSLTQEEALSNSQHVHNNLFVVDAVFDND